MNEKILFSIIIPCYNCSFTIVRAVNSILNQECISQYEIILINDASTDSTEQIIKEMIQSWDKIRYYSLENNSGPGYARNFGINVAAGKYIAFLDADDEWEPNHLLEAYDILSKSNNLVFYFSGGELIQELGINDYRSLGEIQNEILPTFNRMKKKEYVSRLFLSNYISTQSVVVSKKILVKYNGFDIRLRSAQDYDLWLKIFTNEDEGCFYGNNKATVKYYLRYNSISSNYKRRINCLKIIKKRYKTYLFDLQKNKILYYTTYLKALSNIYHATAFELKSRNESIFLYNRIRLIGFIYFPINSHIKNIFKNIYYNIMN